MSEQNENPKQCGNFPVGLVLLWGLKRGDFLAQKGAPKIGQKVAPQSPKPNGKLLKQCEVVSRPDTW
jgi:hypothetical protein